MTPNRSVFTATAWQMTLMGLRYLNGRKLRTFLTTMAIVFGVAMIFAINLILPSIQQAFKQTLTSLTGAEISINSASGVSFEPDEILAQVTGISGIEAASGILHRQISLPSFGADEALGSATQIDLIGVDPATIEQVHPFIVSEGRFLQPGDTGKVLLPAGLVDLAPEVGIGTTFPLITTTGIRIFTVVGLLAEQGSLSTPQLYVTLEDAQNMLNQPGLINAVEASLAPGADSTATNAELQQILGDGFVLNAPSSALNTAAAFQVAFSMFNLLGLLALFLGAFLIFNTFRTVVVERRRDLAMLRAVGATRSQITLMIIIESLVQGIIGTAIGLFLGIILVQSMVSLINSIWMQYLGRGNFNIEYNLFAGIVAAVLGIGTALIAGYFPARSAGRVSPLDALRPAQPAQINRAARWSLIAGAVCMVIAVLMLLSGSRGAVAGALFFMIGMVIAAPGLVLPVARLFSPFLTLWFAREGDIARGNLVRQPGRAAITGSTLMIGLATLVMMAALVASFSSLITSLANVNFSSDILLVPQSISIYTNVVGADSGLSDQLRALPEVETVGTLRYASATVNGQSLEMLGINPEEYQKVASFDFTTGDPAEAYAALSSGRNIMVTSLAASTLNLTVGTDVVLDTAGGPQTYHVVAAANDMFTFKIAAAFISQENLAADFRKTEDVMLMLQLTPGADRQTAFTAVQQAAADYPQFTAHLTGEYRQQIVDTSNSAMGFFYAIAFIILIPSALGLLNTLSINILERTREIGVVRAVGGSRGQIRRIVTAEALLLGIFGAAMGVLAGVAMSYGFISAFSTVGWKMPYFFPFAGIVAAFIVGIMLSLFAAILPARNVARLDIIRALQYQ